jgi:hypothetical protein
MSALSRHLLETDRHAVVTDTIANLNARIHELERLRIQVKEAQLSARGLRPKPIKENRAKLEQ